MARYILGIFLFLILINDIVCFQKKIHKRVDELCIRSEKLYGKLPNRSIKWNENTEKRLAYPGGDRLKLAEIARGWRDHYKCLARLTEQVTPAGHLPGTILMVYSGAVAKIQCGLCVRPGESTALAWMHSKPTNSQDFSPVREKDNMVVEEDGNLTIYHVTSEDDGIYRCQIGSTVGGIVVLEVVDEDSYNEVKPAKSKGPYAKPPVVLDNGLVAFSRWSAWSECSEQNKIGRGRRYGMCYVQFHQSTIKYSQPNINTTVDEDVQNGLQNTTLKLFEDFPSGVPCRSRLLPWEIRRSLSLMERPNEITIGMCKVSSKDVIYERRSVSNEVLEKVNNSAGVLCLAQSLPKQPPLPASDIIFADYGQSVTIRCPGTTLQNVPLSWKIGTKRMVPKELAPGGRVHLNARDHLVFTEVLYADANLYSCWELDKLAGSVKLVVSETFDIGWDHRAWWMVVAATVAAAWHMAHRVLQKKRGRRLH